MATYSNVASGFDVEILIDEEFIRHLIQLFTESEEAVILEDGRLTKFISDVRRDYRLNSIVPVQPAVGDTMVLVEFPDNPDYVYLLISPFNLGILENYIPINLADVWKEFYLVIRLKKKIKFLRLVNDIAEGEGENLYNLYGDIIRLEGVFSGRNLERISFGSPVDDQINFEEFRNLVFGLTNSVYDQLSIALQEEEGTFSSIFSRTFKVIAHRFFLTGLEGYELFLEAIHNLLGIGGSLKKALSKLKPDSPFLPSTVELRAYSTEKKLAVYANFNTIEPRTNGVAGNGRLFASDQKSGIALNLTDSLVEGLILSIVRQQMRRKLGAGEITQGQFDAVAYEYPFSLPQELFDNEELSDNVRNALESIRIIAVTAGFKKHKFPGVPRMDAICIAFNLDIAPPSANDSPELITLIKLLVANPKATFFIGFETINGDLRVHLDSDIAPNLGLLTKVFGWMVTGPFVGGSLSGAILTFSLLENGLPNLLTKDQLVDQVPLEEIPPFGIPIHKKRWDPFYYTQHRIRFIISEIAINERKPQVRINFGHSLDRTPEIYNGIFLKKVSFSPNGKTLTQFTYSVESVEDFIPETLLATDRISGFYNLSSVLPEIAPLEVKINFSDDILRKLLTLVQEEKLRTSLPFSIQFVRLQNGQIVRVKILDQRRKNQLEAIIKVQYKNDRLNDALAQYEARMQRLKPGFSVSSLSEKELIVLKAQLTVRIEESQTFIDFNRSGWREELTNFLNIHPDEMLNLTPWQLVMLGMKTSDSGGKDLLNSTPIPKVFDFISLPEYLAILINDQVVLKDGPNTLPANRLASLPKF